RFGEAAWIGLAGTSPTIWVPVQLLAAEPHEDGGYRLRVSFGAGCPYTFFKATVYGITPTPAPATSGGPPGAVPASPPSPGRGWAGREVRPASGPLIDDPDELLRRVIAQSTSRRGGKPRGGPLPAVGPSGLGSLMLVGLSMAAGTAVILFLLQAA